MMQFGQDWISYLKESNVNRDFGTGTLNRDLALFLQKKHFPVLLLIVAEKMKGTIGLVSSPPPL